MLSTFPHGSPRELAFGRSLALACLFSALAVQSRRSVKAELVEAFRLTPADPSSNSPLSPAKDTETRCCIVGLFEEDDDKQSDCETYRARSRLLFRAVRRKVSQLLKSEQTGRRHGNSCICTGFLCLPDRLWRPHFPTVLHTILIYTLIFTIVIVVSSIEA